MELTVQPHPSLEIGAFVTRFARRSQQLVAPSDLGTAARAISCDTARVLRYGARRGPAALAPRRLPAVGPQQAGVGISARRARENRFPRINAAVDACNVASLWSGLPISLVDVDRLHGALTVGVLAMGTSYVFNPSGQAIDAGGLRRAVGCRGADRHTGQGRAAHEDARRHRHRALDRVGHASAAGAHAEDDRVVPRAGRDDPGRGRSKTSRFPT